jgi:hypothetical protein
MKDAVGGGRLTKRQLLARRFSVQILSRMQIKLNVYPCSATEETQHLLTMTGSNT